MSSSTTRSNNKYDQLRHLAKVNERFLSTNKKRHARGKAMIAAALKVATLHVFAVLEACPHKVDKRRAKMVLEHLADAKQLAFMMLDH
jgi:hypothetical protein